MGSMLTLQAAADATMSSREIADLTGKRHDNVMRVCRELKSTGVTPQIEECRVINDLAGGREFTEFKLNKRDSHVLVARLSPEFTGRLVDRWMELEAAPAPALPNFADPVAAARAWADAEEGKQRAQRELAAAAPAIEFVQRYADSTGTKGFRQVAKLLGAKENLFREFLIDQKILYRLGTELTPHAQHIDAGRFCVKAGTAESGHAFNSARFTPKGVTWVAGEWAKHQVALRQQGGQHAA